MKIIECNHIHTYLSLESQPIVHLILTLENPRRDDTVSRPPGPTQIRTLERHPAAQYCKQHHSEGPYIQWWTYQNRHVCVRV
jgi:hypothetical protein